MAGAAQGLTQIQVVGGQHWSGFPSYYVRVNASATTRGVLTFDGPPGASLRDVMLRYQAAGSALGGGVLIADLTLTLAGVGSVTSHRQWGTVGYPPNGPWCVFILSQAWGDGFSNHMGEPDEPAWVSWAEQRGTRETRIPGQLQPGSYVLEITLSAQMTGHTSAGTCYGNPYRGGVGLDRTVTLATNGPVFDLPVGWTVTSTEFNIVNNQWLGSTTVPVLMQQPESYPGACQAQEVVLAIEATGQEPLAYQWRHDGVDVPNATLPTFTVVAPSAADSGIYECAVSNSLGHTTSHPVPLFVCVADLDCDLDVDLSDLAVLLAHYGTPAGATASQGDLNSDAAVDLTDLALMLYNYGTACGTAP